jgi:ParB family chromosome partitioning protein
MSKNKTVLGRGLGALLSGVGEPDTIDQRDLPTDDGKSVGTICAIDIARVRPNPFQPRVDFSPQALDELKQSILENGVIQPITVRRVEGGFFELISGERRVRASIAAEMTEIPAYILNVESDRGMLELALIENVQRENLNSIEVALGYQRLISECNLTQEEVAQKVGKDRSTVTNFLRLLKLPGPIQASLRSNEISMGHARALLTIPEDGDRLDLWRRVRDEALSVRRTEALVKQVVAQAGSARGRVREQQPDVEEMAEKGAPGRTQLDVMYTEIANRMQQVLGTQVKIRGNAAGAGSITIEFYTSEDLERLLELFAIIERQGH